MLDQLGAIAMAVAPIGALAAGGWLIDARSRRRREAIERQIAVTDAIHRELGAVVAPVVQSRGRRGWLVSIAVPFDRPPVVERVLAIVHRTLHPVPYAVVLTAQPAPVTVGSPGGAGGRPGPCHRHREGRPAAA
jgi:hypothetical protein